jgi:hypothetical protein
MPGHSNCQLGDLFIHSSGVIRVFFMSHKHARVADLLLTSFLRRVAI